MSSLLKSIFRAILLIFCKFVSLAKDMFVIVLFFIKMHWTAVLLFVQYAYNKVSTYCTVTKTNYSAVCPFNQNMSISSQQIFNRNKQYLLKTKVFRLFNNLIKKTNIKIKVLTVLCLFYNNDCNIIKTARIEKTQATSFILMLLNLAICASAITALYCFIFFQD